MTALMESVEKALSSASDTLAKSEAVSKVVAKKRKPILIITVDIGKGKSGDITVFADDSHHNLAVSFCKQHQLSDSLVDAIAKHIQQNVEALQKGRLKKKKEHAARKAREAKKAVKTSKDATSTVASSGTVVATTTTAGQDTATGPPAAPSTKSILDPPPPHTEPTTTTTTTTTLPSKKKKSKKKKTTKKTKISSAEENAKVAALLGQEPPPAFVSKSELERRRKAALRKKKEKEERAIRKQKRLDKKRAKRMKATSVAVVDPATAEKTIGGKKKNKKNKTKKKVDKDVYNRLYNHGMEHWSNVDLTTANRIEEQIKNEEIYTFAPEVHPAPNDAGDSLHAGQGGRRGIHSRLYREGTK
jgi:hypothetical protein